MKTLPISQIPFISPETADLETQALFTKIHNTLDAPALNNEWQVLANSMCTLIGTWQLFSNIYLQGTLPLTLKALILFAIAAAHNCRYCGAMHEATCRVLGVEESTLQTIVQDVDRLTPERIQIIIRFAVRSADEPLSLQKEDYDELRDCGITEEEIVEIIALAAMGTYFDILADALKLEVDTFVQEMLPGEQLVH